MFFQPVTFEFNGARATVKPKDVLRLISVIEQSFDFRGAAISTSWPAATVAIGYAKVLNFVGLEQDKELVVVDEVELAKHLYTNHAEIQTIVEKLSDIVRLIAPPEPEKPAEPDKETPAPEQENSEKKD
jgi:hypothetical protein